MCRLAVVGALFATAVFAQTAQITGRITDPAGAVVPGASVTITQTQTGARRTIETNQDGYYTAPLLQPGTYDVTVDREGFKSVSRTGVVLEVDQVARLDFALELGSMAEKVTVEASAPMLESETSAVGEVVQGRQVVELPLLGRNPYALGALVPGVRVSRGMNDLPVDQISTSSVSINGTRGNQNEFLLDGAPNTAPAQNQPIVYANADSVQEFKVETNNFSAEYGRAAGGVFNVVTKSGSNDVHFSLYEFLRNDKLNANDWFANRAGQRPPPFKFNQFGGVLGGPVNIPHLYNGKNRTFFFVSTELVRFVQGITMTATVPKPEELAGDFSGTRNAAGQPIVIYDPLTTRPNANGPGFIRSPFIGNMIPPDRINAVARNLLKYWPAPNTAGAPFTGVGNFTRTDGNHIQKNTFSMRLDHNFTEKTRFFLRYSYDDSPWTRANAYGPMFIGAPAVGPQDFTRYNAVVEGDHIFSPTLIAELRGSFSRLSNFRGPFSQGFDITKLGFPAGLPQQIGAPAAFPAIVITGLSASGSIPNSVIGGSLGNTGLIAFGMNNYALQGAITKSLAKHSIRAGGEVRVIQFNTVQTGDQSTQFTFSPSFTQGPNPAQSSQTSGYALATFLLGIAGGSVTPSPALAMQSTYYAGFVQDDWRVTSKLTLNLGLRYEVETPRKDRFNQFTNFDYKSAVPLQAPGLDLHGALSFVGVHGVSRYQGNPDLNNWAPRVGFAWSARPGTVIRGGGGIFYAPLTGIGGAPNSFGISGFLAATSINTSLDGFTPVTYLDNPYPEGLNKASGNSLGPATLLGQSVTFYDRGNRTPYTGQWNFDVQQQFGGSVLLDVAYVGTRGLKFPTDREFDQLPDAYLAMSDSLRQQVPNPFYGQIAVGTLAQKTVARAQLLRPYPQFQGVTSAVADWASSMYHSLQVKVEKRTSKGLTMLAAYTYSKLMDYSTGVFSGETLGGGAIQDWNNIRADWGVSSLDETHRLIVNFVYEIPFLRAQHGFAGHILGGWEIGAIGSFYSGSPLGITSAVNNTFSQGGSQRPDWTGKSAQIDSPTPNRWFDTTQFSNPPAYHFGNAPRTFGGLRSDATRQVDLSLHKNTQLTEKLRLQFRAEAFNLTNTPVFAPPNTAYGNSQFGVVSSQANQPRIVQLALKLMM